MNKKLYIDADSFPVNFRQIILKRVMKDNLEAIFVADRKLKDVELARDQHSAFLRDPFRGLMDKEELRKIKSTILMVVVETGANSADDHIIENIKEGDMLITHDIPLADRAVTKGAIVLDDRGNTYTKENIKARLSERNMMCEFRSLGLQLESQGRMSDKVKTEFANAFDKALIKFKG